MFIGTAYATTGSDTCAKKDRQLLRFVSTMSQMNRDEGNTRRTRFHYTSWKRASLLPEIIVAGDDCSHKMGKVTYGGSIEISESELEQIALQKDRRMHNEHLARTIRGGARNEE